MKINEIVNPEKEQKLNGFLDDFWSKVTPHPFVRGMGLIGNYVGIELTKFEGTIHIKSIMSFAEKNAGYASQALKWLCDLADKHGVVMDLYVKPIKNAGAAEGKNLNKAELQQWYARYGFLKAKNQADTMVRQPKHV